MLPIYNIKKKQPNLANKLAKREEVTTTANQETHKSVEDIILQDSPEQPEQPELLVLLVPGPPQLTTFSFFGVTKKNEKQV